MEIALEVIEKGRLSVSVCADRSDYGNVSFLKVGVNLWYRRILISICTRRKKANGRKASDSEHAVQDGGTSR